MSEKNVDFLFFVYVYEYFYSLHVSVFSASICILFIVLVRQPVTASHRTHDLARSREAALYKALTQRGSHPRGQPQRNLVCSALVCCTYAIFCTQAPHYANICFSPDCLPTSHIHSGLAFHRCTADDAGVCFPIEMGCACKRVLR